MLRERQGIGLLEGAGKVLRGGAFASRAVVGLVSAKFYGFFRILPGLLYICA